MELPQMEQDKIKDIIDRFDVTDIKAEEIDTVVTGLRKRLIEKALEGELAAHLGYERYARTPSANSRNGKSQKTVKTEKGSITIDVPRDREGSFEPRLVQKGQRRSGVLDQQVIALYSKGMTTREITSTIKEMYDVEISPSLVSHITESVIEDIRQWQNRPLDGLYPIVFMDGIVVKVRDGQRILSKSIHVVLGINLQGKKELLGLWITENEGAKFWLGILTELKNRGLEDILIACVDGLKGFPEAIEAVYPKTAVQVCIVHMVRNSLKTVSWKDYAKVTTQLKTVYQAVNEQEALANLERFREQWPQYARIADLWERNWARIATLFSYEGDIRRVIYTTNAIESLNSVIRKATTRHKMFPDDGAALKVTWLAIMDASRRWTMPIQNWRSVLNRFCIEFGERVSAYL